MTSIYRKPTETRDPLSPYTYREAAKVLRVHEYTISAWVKKNLIRTIKLGEKRFIPADELARVAKEGTGNGVVTA